MNEYVEHIKNVINREKNLFAERSYCDVDHLKVFEITSREIVLVCTISLHGQQIFSEYDKYVLADWKTKIRRYYTISGLVMDIKKVIDIKELKREIKGENKMNNKMYRVSGINMTTSSLGEMDEITFTVNVLQSRFDFTHATREDCDRIREAIESIGEKNESHYIVCGRGNGKTNWRNEYQKERDKFDIKDVIFNNPATIVFWEDGTKTVVKAENEPFDPEKGLAMAIAKKALGNNYDYYDVFKKYVGRYEKKQKKGEK